MSKVGTKHAAVECDPVQYLTNFAENDNLSESDIQLGEHYLVRVYAGVRSTTTCMTFDALRLENYVGGASLDCLPPTSSVIRGHIQRAAYLIRQACLLLDLTNDDRPDDPVENGWINEFGMLLPAKCLKPLPEKVLKSCKCEGTCESKRCTCKAAGVRCIIYCHGKDISVKCNNKTNALTNSNTGTR